MHRIYFIVNKATEKVYVGLTRNTITKRFSSHKCDLRQNRSKSVLLQNAWNKYTEAAFECFEVGQFETHEQVCEAEQFYIRWFREIGMSYNLTDGGDGGVNPSQETREKLRQRWVDQPHPRLGVEVTEETRQRMAQAKVGVPRGPHSEEHSARIAEANRAVWTDEKRQEMSERKKGNTYFEGKSHSEETKQAMSESRKGELNPNYGKPSSEAQKQAASKTWKGVKRGPMSEETKQKLREARALQPRVPCSDVTKEKIRQKKLERDAAEKA